MSLLFKHLRVHQIFGANTDVGKTVLTTALIRVSASNKNSVFYLKPVSTGPRDEADDRHVKRYTGAWKDLVETECLYQFREPVSPHIAAELAHENSPTEVLIPSDTTLVNSIASSIRRCASLSTRSTHVYVETSGGVHSPMPSGTTQLDSYRPLFLPTVLIGDSRLGGISSTISSYESLVLRGYIVDSILLFQDQYYRNWEYLAAYFAERGVHVSAIDPPPHYIADAADNLAATEKYYTELGCDDKRGGISDLLRHLDTVHERRLKELESLAQRSMDSIWWPFVQHGLLQGREDVTVIDSAWSDFFSVYKPERISSSPSPSSSSSKESSLPNNSPSVLQSQFDGSASWWTQALGHAHPSLALAAARAAGRYGHVMFPQAIHLPALKLAERLLQDGPGKGWASRVFFSDDGSTGMEIALKMALRAFSVRESLRIGKPLDSRARKALGIVGLKGSYHGDTIGAMDACEEGVFTCEWHNSKGYWFDPPTVAIQRGKTVVSLPSALTARFGTNHIDAKSLSWVYEVSERLNTRLADVYRVYIADTLRDIQESGGLRLAALVLEPLVMGAGGMIFVDPLFQRIMIDVVRGTGANSPSSAWSGMPVIYDEVFVGLYRMGVRGTASLLGVNPDISVNAKILTGGLLPLAVTLSSDSIFQAFMSQNKVDALHHGHSYTAHPVGCEVANETLSIVEGLASSDVWKEAQSRWADFNEITDANIWSFWNPDFVRTISHMDMVGEVMTLGTVLVIKIRDGHGGYLSSSAKTLLASIDITDDKILSSAPGGAPYGVHFRTLGNVAYFMTSLNTPSTTVRSVEDRIWATLKRSCKLI